MDPHGFLQGDVGDLAGVSGSRRARLRRQGGGDAVGASWALPEAGEGGARDRGWGATLLLPGPGHRHIQWVVASNIADEGGWRGCVQQAQSYFGGSLDVELDDLLSLEQGGGDLTDVGPLIL